MQYGELVTIDGKLFVKSSLDCHGDEPIPVIRGWENFGGDYYFVTEEPDENGPEAFGFIQTIYGWEWGYIYENHFKTQRAHIWRIKDIDLPYAGKR